MGKVTLLISIAIILFVMEGYKAQNDITFIIDTSSGITSSQFNTMIDFVYDVTNQLTIGTDSNRVAVVTFNDTQTTQFDLDDHTEKTNILNAIDNLRTLKIRGSRRTNEALSFVDRNIYSDPTGGTPVALLLTYGEGTSPNDMLFAVYLLENIQMRYVIGIGAFVTDSTKQLELQYAASDPDNHFLYLLQEFSELCSNISEIALKLDANATNMGNHSCSATKTVNDHTEANAVETTPSETSHETTYTIVVSTTSIKTTSGTTVDNNVETTSTGTTVDNVVETTSSESLHETTFTPVVSSTSMTTSTYTTLSFLTSTNSSVNTDNFSPSSDYGGSMFTAIIAALIVIILVISVISITALCFLKNRKSSKLVCFITLVVHEYPDIRNGPGPSKQRYTNHRPQVHKNGHSNKFRSYLKLSMMMNGIKTVSR